MARGKPSGQRAADRSRTRTLRAVLTLFLLVMPMEAVRAQNLGMLSSNDPLGGELAERGPVLERLDSAFAREQIARLASARARLGDEAADFEPSEAMARIRTAYVEEAGHVLFTLQGDGSLTLGEVAEALPEVRDRHLRRFENVIEAISRGHEPPPRREEFDSTSDYLLTSARYTLTGRNSPLAWGQVLLCALAGVLLAIVLSRSLRHLSREVTHLDYRGLGAVLDSVRLPLILVAAAGGLLVGLRFLWLPAETEDIARRTLTVFIVGLVFLGGWNLCDEIATSVVGMIRRTTGRPALEHVRRLVKRALRVLLVGTFLVVVSRFTFGVGFTGMLAGLGVVGVGLWVLMRGVIENVAASFTLFGDGVFRIGDLIVHDGEWGTVEDIGFRSTRCRTLSGHMLHIPNRNLVDETIRNVSARPWVRARFRLSLVYDTSPDKLDEAIAIVHAVIGEQGEAVNRDEGVNVVFDAFGEHDLQLLVQYHTASDDYWTAKETMGAVNRALLHRLHDAGIDFAFPTRTTVLANRHGEPLALDVGGTARDRAADEEDGEDTKSGGARDGWQVPIGGRLGRTIACRARRFARGSWRGRFGGLAAPTCRMRSTRSPSLPEVGVRAVPIGPRERSPCRIFSEMEGAPSC